MSYYIYILTKPDGDLFYVGKTNNLRHRLRGHELEARKGCLCSKCEIVRSVWEQGDQIQQQAISTVETEAEAFEQEQYFIAHFGRENLTNQADGGAGTKGHSLSAEAKAKISKIQKAYFADSEWREEFRSRMADPERRAKMAIGLRANWDNNPERRDKASERTKEQWSNPEIKAKRIARMKESRNTPEYKAAQSERMKQVHMSRRNNRENTK
jgi:predicted GIY-YIG superfamily endonuclease